MSRPESRGANAHVRRANRLRRHARRRRAGRRRDDSCRRGDPLRRRDQLAAAAAALRRRRRRRSSARSAIDVVHDLPGVGENLQDHLEVYVQRSSKLPVTVAPAFKWRNRPLVGAEVAPLQVGAGRDESLRGGRVRPLERRRRVPERDVPLPADRSALRRDGAAGPWLPAARRPDVLGRARIGEDHVDRSARASGAALQLPLDRPGPARVGRERPRGSLDPRPAGVRAVRRRRAVARPGRRDR